MSAAEEIQALAVTMRENIERWFPGLHHDPLLPLAVFYALGLGGEAGEVLDEIKKAYRTDGDLPARENLKAELADVFTYLLLLADEVDIDLVAAYEEKAEYNEARWGTPSATVDVDVNGTTYEVRRSLRNNPQARWSES